MSEAPIPLTEGTGMPVLSQIHGKKCWPLTGKLSPGEEACPLHTDVPGYIMTIQYFTSVILSGKEGVFSGYN